MGLTRLQKFAYLLRKLHLLQLANSLWFFRHYWISRKSNVKFKIDHPEIPVPPLAMLYDIQGNCNLSGYFQSGREQAQELAAIISSERPDEHVRILEWGCGPARILQHLSSTASSDWELWGSDYNPETISWCQQNWPTIHFIHNGLEPPIQTAAGFFDVIYCVSVFTHLSEERHYQWISEIMRLLKPNGIFIGTFHGDAYRSSLTKGEQVLFDSGNLVVRDNIREGKKDFAAYHCDDFVRRFLAQFSEVKKLDSVPGFSQTIWTAKKRNE